MLNEKYEKIDKNELSGQQWAALPRRPCKIVRCALGTQQRVVCCLVALAACTAQHFLKIYIYIIKLKKKSTK